MKNKTKRTTSSLEKKARGIAAKLRKKGHVAYFAGGCVRDMVMKQTPKDYDIATTATPDEVETLFPKCIPVGKQFGVILVVAQKNHFEVATFRREGTYQDGRHPQEISFTTPETDATRRDFTVNGLFFDPSKGEIIDFVEGRKDIKARTIRTIGKPEERFDEDRLRLLRAVRFAANLGFAIDPPTWKAIKKMAKTIHSVSSERIRDELVKMFTRPNAGKALELLSESGLLSEILPEIEIMKGVEQPPQFHPEGDVFIHTRMLLDQLKDPSIVLAFGALLHDVGKPPTFTDDGKRIRFNNHAHVGAEMSREMLKRFRFSNKEIEGITSCVEHHMTFANVKEMRVGKLKRFIARETFLTELEMHRIDCLASHGSLDLYRFLKRKLSEFEQEELKPKPLLNGHLLMSAGFKAGPIMKTILEEAYSEQLEGKIKTKDQAVKWAKKSFSTELPKRKGKG